MLQKLQATEGLWARRTVTLWLWNRKTNTKLMLNSVYY